MSKLLKPSILDVDPSSPTAKEEYKHWKRTLESFFRAAGDEQVNKLDAVINFISPRIYTLISDAATYEAALEKLQSLYMKEKHIIFSRYQLLTKKQEAGQSIDTFVYKLTELASEIEFKDVNAQDYRSDLLVHSLVQGVNNPFIRQRLLESGKTKFDDIYTLARSLEAALVNSGQMSNDSYQAAAVIDKRKGGNDKLKVNSGAFSPNTNSCWFCGGRRHPRERCPAKDVTCYGCQRKGHFKSLCRYKDSVAASLDSTMTPQLSSVFGYDYDPDNTLANVNIIQNIPSKPIPFSPHVMINIVVKGYTLASLIDTGAKINCLDAGAAAVLKPVIRSSSINVSLAALGSKPVVVGECTLDIMLKDKRYEGVNFIIIQNLVSSVILGHDFLKRFKSLNINFQGKPSIVLSSINDGQEESVSPQIVTPEPEVKPQLTPLVNISPPKLFENMVDNVYPIATKTRKFNETDSIFIKSEIDKLLYNGVIEESFSPWRAQVHIDKANSKKHRLVIDYSRTINKFTLLDAYPFPNKMQLVTKISQYKVFSTYDLKSAYHQVEIPETDRKYTAFEACGKLFQFKRMPFGPRNAVSAFQRIMDKDIIEKNNLKGTFAYVDNIFICGTNQIEHDYNLKQFLNAASSHNITFNDSKTVVSTNKLDLLGYTICDGKILPDEERVKPLKALSIPKDSKALKRALGMFSYYSTWIPQFSDKIHPLTNIKDFPLSEQACKAFKILKESLTKATLGAIDENSSFTVETDASNVAISASLNQNGRPVAFMSRMLHGNELKHSSVEKEAYAIYEALCKWKYLLIDKHFKLITDQKAVSFMYGPNPNKIKNDKILRWRLELSPLSYSIVFRPGVENVVPDALSRPVCTIRNDNELIKLHDSLCHPGITRFYHFVKMKNMPYSVTDIKQVVSNCSVCCELKPRYLKKETQSLIKATRPFQCLDLDFKGPLPSTTENKYILTVVDEWSRFPFAFPVPNTNASTVISCLKQLFVIFGMPNYIHSDRGSQFLSNELKNFLHSNGVVTSKTTSYNPRGNGLTERYNGIIWKTVLLSLKSKRLNDNQWEFVLPMALHSIRSLLNTTTNQTPHDRFFSYPRKSVSGVTLPDWLTPGLVLCRRYVRRSKTDPLVDEVELLEANPNYAYIRYPDGRESTVALRHLAPAGGRVGEYVNAEGNSTDSSDSSDGPQNNEFNFKHDSSISDSVHNSVVDPDSIQNHSFINNSNVRGFGLARKVVRTSSLCSLG